MAEFDTPTDVVQATRRTYEAGYRKIDAYSPFPIEELNEALGMHKDSVSLIVLLGGIFGGTLGFLLQYWINTIDYPVNIGGRPLNSWPAFIVVTFELTILGASLFGVFGMLAMNGLPQPHHPVFNVPRFAFATRDRFFLCIEATDPMFQREETMNFLQSLGARSVSEVPSD
jgi:hypothetical protein